MAVGENKLHLGCELNTPEGWIHLDGSWGAYLAKYPKLRTFLRRFKMFPQHLLDKPWNPDILVHDLRKPLPFKDNDLTAIYASHVLEHLYLTEAKNLLRECYRVLAPGGILRVVVPDLRAMVMDYVAGKPGCDWIEPEGSLSPADMLNKRLGLRADSPPRGHIIYRLYSILKDFHSHKWMYDAESLSKHLEQAGFADILAMAALETRIAGIKGIENPDRIVGGVGVCVEGIKPG
jgi:ubiquinone/menaquinone biosynthesis C-methylase UbiE